MIRLDDYKENNRIYLYLCTNIGKQNAKKMGALWDREKINPFLGSCGCWFINDDTADVEPFLAYIPKKETIVDAKKKNLYMEKNEAVYINLSKARDGVRSLFKTGVLNDFLVYWRYFADLDVYNAILRFLHNKQARIIGNYEFWNSHGYHVKGGMRGFPADLSLLKSEYSYNNVISNLRRHAKKGLDTLSFGFYTLSVTVDGLISLYRYVYKGGKRQSLPVFTDITKDKAFPLLKAEIDENRYFEGVSCGSLWTEFDVEKSMDSPYANSKIETFENPWKMADGENLRLCFALLAQLSGMKPIYLDECITDDTCVFIPASSTPATAMRLLIMGVAKMEFSGVDENLKRDALYVMLCDYFSLPVGDDAGLLLFHEVMNFEYAKSDKVLRVFLESIRYAYLKWNRRITGWQIDGDMDNVREFEGYHTPFFKDTCVITKKEIEEAENNIFIPEDEEDKSETTIDFDMTVVDSTVNDAEKEADIEEAVKFDIGGMTDVVYETNDSSDIDTNSVIYGINYDDTQDADSKALADATISIRTKRRVDADNIPFRFEYGEISIGSDGFCLTFNLKLMACHILTDGSTLFTLSAFDVGAKKQDNKGECEDGFDESAYNFDFFLNHPRVPVTSFTGEIFENNSDTNVSAEFLLDKVNLRFSNNAYIQMTVSVEDSNESESDIKDNAVNSEDVQKEDTDSEEQKEGEIKETENKEAVIDDSTDNNIQTVTLIPSNKTEEKNTEHVKRKSFEEVEKEAVNNGVAMRYQNFLILLTFEKAMNTVPFLRQYVGEFSKGKMVSIYEAWKVGWLQADRLIHNHISAQEWENTQLLAVSFLNEKTLREKNYISTFMEFFSLFEREMMHDTAEYDILQEQKSRLLKNSGKFITLAKDGNLYKVACIPKAMNENLQGDDVAKCYNNTFLLRFLSGYYRINDDGVSSKNEFSLNTQLANRIISFLGVDLNLYNDKVVNFYVAECGEFPSAGFYREGLSFEEAINLYMRLDSTGELGKAIGVTMENGSATPYDTQIYPLNFTATQMEPFKSNKVVQNACAFILGKIQAHDIFDSNKRFLGEPTPLPEAIKKDNVTVDIYQIKDGRGLIYKWRDYNYLVYTMKKKIESENYNKVVSMTIKSVRHMDTLLETIFTLGNTKKERFTPYILEGQNFDNISVGDIIALTTKEYIEGVTYKQSIAYYVNTEGFVKLPNFCGMVRGAKVLRKENPLYRQFIKSYAVSASLAVWEAGQALNVPVSEDCAKVIASIDGMVLQMPKDDKSLASYIKKGRAMAKSVLSIPSIVMVQISCSRYPIFKGGAVFSIKEIDHLIAMEKVAISKYYKEHGIDSYIGDDEVRLNIFLKNKEQDELVIYTLPLIIRIGNLQFKDFISDVERNLNDLIRSCREAVEIGNIFGVPLTSEKKIELRDAINNLNVMAESINKSAILIKRKKLSLSVSDSHLKRHKD